MFSSTWSTTLAQQDPLSCISWMRAPWMPRSSPGEPVNSSRTCRVQAIGSRCEFGCFRSKVVARRLELEWYWFRLRASSTWMGNNRCSRVVKCGRSEGKWWWKGDSWLGVKKACFPVSNFSCFPSFSFQFLWFCWLSRSCCIIVDQPVSSSRLSFFQFHFQAVNVLSNLIDLIETRQQFTDTGQQSDQVGLDIEPRLGQVLRPHGDSWGRGTGGWKRGG